jgi:hypothetical protein
VRRVDFEIAANDVPGAISKAPNFGISLVLIDTPGYSDAPALAAIPAADLTICPTRASLFDVAALKDTVALLDLAGMRDPTDCSKPHRTCRQDGARSRRGAGA